MDPVTEPLIHSHHTDRLPDEDVRARQMLLCQRCKKMVHADNNECMQTWVEWGEGILCGRCFAPLLQSGGVLEYAKFIARCEKSPP